MGTAAVNVGVWVSLPHPDLSSFDLIVVVPFYISVNGVQGLQFLHVLTDTSHFAADNNQPKRCELTSHCGFDLCFPDDSGFVPLHT